MKLCLIGDLERTWIYPAPKFIRHEQINQSDVYLQMRTQGMTSTFV